MPFKKTVILLLIVLCFTSIHVFGQSTQKAKSSSTKKKWNLNLASFPRIDGSTSTQPLEMIIACKMLNVSYQWPTSSPYVMEKRVFPISADTTLNYIVNNIYRKTMTSSTHYAYENLILGIADLIFEARSPSPDELDLAQKCNIKLTSKPIALDAFVFLLNKNNPVQNLTIQQIRDIYTDKITQWDMVGGTTGKINAYQREDNSGSQELMKSLVMKELPISKGDYNRSDILYSMMGPFNKLSQDTSGLSYSVFYYNQNMAYNENTKLCAINGIMPDMNTLKSRKYPLTTEVYAVIRSDLDKKSPAYQIYDWLTTPEGQSLVKESGYIPIRE